MLRHLTFNGTSAAFAAGLASVVMALAFALYVPFMGIICDFRPIPDMPQIRAGNAYWEKPETYVVSVKSDATVYIGALRVQPSDVADELRTIRRIAPDRPIELRVSGRVTLGQLEPVLSAMREAGYSSYFVFGSQRALIAL
ncbi:MAG TPA: biopolymer transporter ExbD [Thermoanaerobaculia bacterium]|jgi:biopolymer transport protein ExbD|nr:biopolymer transporter ExbD [Thermoanaerobaculia bacterium]